MSSLPLWKLPFLARKNIFHQMNPNDVFNLSMTSLKSKLIIMTFHKLPSARLSWFIGTHQSNHWNGTSLVWRIEDQMKLYIYFVDPNLFGIRVFVEEPREGEYLRNPSLRNVNRTPILMSTGDLNEFRVCKRREKRTFNQKMKVMEMISKHLLDIVNVESYDLHYSDHTDLPTRKLIKCFVFDITRKFRDVNFFNHHQKLRTREFNFLMNDIQADEMTLNTVGKVRGVFTHKKIEFGRRSAVSFDNILNLQCEKFESRMDTLLKSKEFVKLLLAWSNGEKLQNLKKLIIHHAYELYKKNLIRRIKKRIQELEGEVPFEIFERVEPVQPDNDVQDLSDEESDEEDVDDEEEEDNSEESEQEDVEMVDEEESDDEKVDVDDEEEESERDSEEVDTEKQDADKQTDSEEITGKEDSSDEKVDKKASGEAVRKSVELESDDEENGTDKDNEESDADSEEDIDSGSDSEDEVVDQSDSEESDADDQDDVDEDEEDEILIKRKSDGKVMRLQFFLGSFEIEDETTNE